VSFKTLIVARCWKENVLFHCIFIYGTSCSLQLFKNSTWFEDVSHKSFLLTNRECVQQIYLPFKAPHFCCQTARSKDSSGSRLIGCSAAVLVPTSTLLSKASAFQSTHRSLRPLNGLFLQVFQKYYVINDPQVVPSP